MEFKAEDVVNAKQRFVPKKIEPNIDWAVTKIVGHKVFATDPRLTKYIIEWKGNKPMDSTKPDNFLQNPEFIKGLKKALSQGL